MLDPKTHTRELDTFLAAHRRFLYLCTCLFVLALAWSLLCNLAIVIEAIGQVNPSTKV